MPSTRSNQQLAMTKLLPVTALLFGIALAPSAGAASIEVVPWLAPNFFGSPSFPTAQSNAVQAMYLGVSSFGAPGTPGYFQARSNVTTAEAVVTGFNSWLGKADPGTAFGSAFANELGNRMTFALRVDGGGTQFSISQMSFSAVSTDPSNALNFGFSAGDYDYGSGYVGVLKGADGLLWTADDTFVSSGANTQLVDGLVGRGSGNSLDAYCTSCSIADQQTQINNTAAYPGFDFTFTGTYTIGADSGSGAFNVAAVPEPETYGMLLAGLGLLGFMARRRKQKEAACKPNGNYFL